MSKRITYTIPKQTELRINCFDSEIKIQLISGKAEIFGFELQLDEEIIVANESFAICSWYINCQIIIEGEMKELPYISQSPNTSILQCVSLHIALNVGKRATLMITGKPNSGKTTTCCVLLNYAIRDQLKPLFIDLNVENNLISGLYGTIGCAIVDQTSMFNNIKSNDFLSLYFGYSNVRQNPDFFKSQCEYLKSLIIQKYGSDYKDGMIIRVPLLKSLDYDFLLDLAKIFNIDTLLILDDEALFEKTKRDSKLNKNISVNSIPKFQGSVDKQNRKTLQTLKVTNYFKHFEPLPKLIYNIPQDVQVVKIVTSHLAESALPIGQKRKMIQNFTHEEINVNPISKGQLVAIISPFIAENEAQIQEPDFQQAVLGYAQITECNLHGLGLSACSEFPTPCKLFLISSK